MPRSNAACWLVPAAGNPKPGNAEGGDMQGCNMMRTLRLWLARWFCPVRCELGKCEFCGLNADCAVCEGA
jgi:hypothetical protein